MFNRRARKVTASSRYFPPLGNATFGGSLPSELKLYWLWQRKWKKKTKSQNLWWYRNIHILHIRAVCIESGMRSCRVFAALYLSISWSFSLSSGGSRPSDKGEGGRHPDPSDKRGGPVSKTIFFGLKIRGAGPPGPLPWLRHCSESFFDFWFKTNRKKGVNSWVATFVGSLWDNRVNTHV